jgi:hypothetical protein
MKRLFLKLFKYKYIFTIIFMIAFFSTTHFAVAQRDNFDNGNVFDPFDWGNIDPSEAQLDTNSNVFNPSQNTDTQVFSYCNKNFDNLRELLEYAQCFIQANIFGLIFTFAIVLFIIGIIKYVISADPKELLKGRQYILWGIIALFFMTALWGIVRVVGNTFGIDTVLPLFPTDQ